MGINSLLAPVQSPQFYDSFQLCHVLLLQVRFGTLKVLQELYTKLGEEMVVLLPETTSYLYELMEGESASPCILVW